MINLFFNNSPSIQDFNGSQRVDGPTKVVINLIKGLSLAGIEYSINQKKYDNSLVLHEPCIYMAGNTENVIIGPTIWVFNKPFFYEQNYKFIISPSEWVTNLFLKVTPIKLEKILTWPVGIDTDIFNEKKDEIKYDCLIYFKRRSLGELEHIQNFLDSLNQNYITIKYGEYIENDLIAALKQSKYCILIDKTESQGMAYLEILSTNTPIFSWDVEVYTDEGKDYMVPASATPYWSDECGEKIFDIKDIPNRFEKFLKNVDNYKPRNYILRELNLKKQATEIFNAFKK